MTKKIWNEAGVCYFEFLDKELQKLLSPEDDTGTRVVDKLVKVFLRDGSEKWLLIHIEIQGYPEINFSKRVFHEKSIFCSSFIAAA